VLRPPYDHDIVEDLDGRLYIVIGNMHPPNAIMAFIKYIPCHNPTLWRRGNIYYYRVMKHYGVKNMRRYISPHQKVEQDPVYGAYVPLVKTSRIAKYYYPEERLDEIMRKSCDALEKDVIEAVLKIATSSGISVSSMGITGSILAKIHNVSKSDIDVLVYGCKESINVIESELKGFNRMPSNLERLRLEGQSKIYGIPLRYLRAIQAPFKRLFLGKREVNISFAEKKPHKYGEFTYRQVSAVEATVYIEPRRCEALFYPSKARIQEIKDLKIDSEFNVLREDIIEVISFESIYSYILYKGGLLRIKGMLEEVKPLNKYVILVGGYESPGYVIPAIPA
jgi:hypothetical protein